MHLGGQSAKVGLSAKFGVAVFKASILNYPGGPLAKVGSSAKFGVVVFKTSMLNSVGDPSATVCSSAKFCVLVIKASLLDYPGGSIGLSSLFANWYSRHLSSITWGVHLPKDVCLPSFVYW